MPATIAAVPLDTNGRSFLDPKGPEHEEWMTSLKDLYSESSPAYLSIDIHGNKLHKSHLEHAHRYILSLTDANNQVLTDFCHFLSISFNLLQLLSSLNALEPLLTQSLFD